MVLKTQACTFILKIIIGGFVQRFLAEVLVLIPEHVASNKLAVGNSLRIKSILFLDSGFIMLFSAHRSYPSRSTSDDKFQLISETVFSSNQLPELVSIADVLWDKNTSKHFFCGR